MQDIEAVFCNVSVQKGGGKFKLKNYEGLGFSSSFLFKTSLKWSIPFWLMDVNKIQAHW